MVRRRGVMRTSFLVFLTFCVFACGSSPDQGDGGTNPDGGAPPGDAGDGATSASKVIFVIPMENQDQTAIVGNTTDAPYINGTLLPAYASASNFGDELPSLVSE